MRRKLKSLPIEIRAVRSHIYLSSCVVCGRKKRRSEDGRFILNSVLSSVDIPTITALGSNAVREKYLTEVVNAYDETRKGKNGV